MLKYHTGRAILV